ncbi:MAG: EF-P lysine aminoacylase EpmA [Desulfobacteraceae bacterium]|nr:EF-P lysine aminoacylase EpmA [Desulfobacteraceae bacterium]
MKIYRQFQIKKNLHLRAQVLQAVRGFFIQRQYLEVDTPVRIPAPAPEAHIDAVATEDWFLQTSPELCMKQLLAAGFAKVFQICKCFRSRERGRQHLPELTMLEWYKAEGDYTDLMDDCQKLIGVIVEQTTGNRSLCYQGQSIHLDPPWTRMSVEEAFGRYASMGPKEALAKNCFEEVMVNEIEPHLGATRPLFLYDYPAELGALARIKPENPLVAERFELYVAGLELCNGFSELADPVEQRKRFEAEQKIRKSYHKPVYPMPQNFLTALNDMPAAAGNALGIDRLVMLLADTTEIDDVVAFVPEEL